MFAFQRIQVILCLLLSLLIIFQISSTITTSLPDQQTSNKNGTHTSYAQNKSNHQSTNEQNTGIDDILKDTFQLLDTLDQKLASVNNRTPSVLMRDNLRSFDAHSTDNVDKQQQTSLSQLSRLNDDELVKLASSFSSGRKLSPLAHESDDALAMAASDGELHVASFTSNGNTQADGQQIIHPRARQLVLDETSLALSENDSTERHLKFTLNLMQAIFNSNQPPKWAQQANPLQLESFLISPLSIQMVLMMMHLGARGQTKREISNCLNLLSGPASDKIAVSQVQSHGIVSSSVSSGDLGEVFSAKLKRRQQQQQQQQPNGNGAKPSSGPSPSSPGAQRHNLQTNHQNALGHSQANQNLNVHELFSGAMRNLLKDPIVMKALTSANQIFLQKNLPLSPQFERALRHYYGTELRQVNFQHQSAPSTNANATRPLTDQLATGQTNVSSPSSAGADSQNIQQLINDWVERQTRGRISNFLSAPVPTSTLLMAINVLFFKGDWQYKFDPADTQTDAWFTQANGQTVKLPMMVNKLPLAYAHDPIMKTSVVELPYKAQRLGLFVLLPDEVEGIFHTMRSLNSTSFANLISSMRKPAPLPNEQPGEGGINVRIPKFTIESSPRLSQILSQQLGLKTLFAPDVADLSGMFAAPKRSSSNATSPPPNGPTTPLAEPQPAHYPVPSQFGLDELLHKAVLQVDEQGSVAAASSATAVERIDTKGHYFEADHPFLLFLMDKQTGLVLFSGIFAGPGGANQQTPAINSNDTQIGSNGVQQQAPAAL